jgi:hypothetical protein
VFHAEGHPRQAGARPPKPCPAALAGRRQPEACPADPADPADVARLTPPGHPTVNLDGRYRTTSRPPTTGLRPLRTDLLRILYRSSSRAESDRLGHRNYLGAEHVLAGIAAQAGSPGSG